MDEIEEYHLFGQHFEIICGTNEEYLIAFIIKYGKDGRFVLHSSFANHSHCSGIRRLAICGHHLISGGTDEMIHVFNLKKRSKIGVIGEHEGTITDLQQHKQRYVFSASEDGKICIFKEGEWECKKRLVGHRGAVHSVSVHPSGRLALSVGVDRTLHTWDLVKGRKAYVSTLKDACSMVRWSPSGADYVVVVDSRIDNYLVKSAMITHSIDFYVRINDITFLQEHVLLVALENGKVALLCTATGRTLQQWEAHNSRVRALAAMPILPAQAQQHRRLYLVTGSSDGWVKVWALQKDDLKTPAECLSSKNTQCRITCIVAYTHEDYLQAVKSRTQEQALIKANQMLHRSKRSGMPRGRPSKKKAMEKDSDDEDDVDEKPVVVMQPAKKMKKLTIIEPVMHDDDEEHKDDVRLEVIHGHDALKALGFSKSVRRTSELVASDETLERSRRKNRGIPAKKYIE